MRNKRIFNIALLAVSCMALSSCLGTGVPTNTSSNAPTTTETTPSGTTTVEPTTTTTVEPTTTTTEEPITTEPTTIEPEVEKVRVTFLDSNQEKIKDVIIDKGSKVTETVTAPNVIKKEFDSWVINNTTAKVDLSNYTFAEDVDLIATYTNIAPISFTSEKAQTEAAYVKFNKMKDASSYNVYLDDSTSPLTEKDYYTQVKGDVVRIDVFGLTSGNHTLKVAPVYSNIEDDTLASTTSNLVVEAYDRSGYAHFNYTSGVGAYNDNGTLKDNAIVLYVTDENKNSVTLSYNGTTVTGIGNILNSVGADNGSGKAQNGTGTPNTNQKIIQKLGEANIPLAVRFVGCVSDSGLKAKGEFDAETPSLIQGLTAYDSDNYGGTEGDNGHMARMKSGKNITLEGVGSDAVIDGWGFHFIAESSTEALGLGKSFEVRNLTFINTPEDAIGMEGVQASKNESSDLTASVERCWIHNNEFYGPHIKNPAESDKGEGDGSCDFKRGQYLTVSYNYFEGCHKTNLVGSADYSLQFNLSYHHNYWYMCKARGPLTRRANVHMYNNVFYGQTDYAMNTRADAYIFSEYNLFYFCKNPQAVEGGAIKSYNDSFSSYIQNNGSIGTIVNDKNAVVSNNCQFSARGIKYDKFDTDSNLSYIPTGDYELQTDLVEARKVVFAKAGVTKETLVKVSDVTMNDISYVNAVVKNTTINDVSVPSTVTPGKLSKVVYAFKLTTEALVKVTYTSNELASTGVLCNQAGVALLTASGAVQLQPGIYFIQAMNFQPGDPSKLTQGSFKDVTVSSIEFKTPQTASDVQVLINNADTIAKCEAAIDAYNTLNAEQKELVTGYSNMLVTYTMLLIDDIGTVTASSGSKIDVARTQYDSLSASEKALVTNLSTLTAAEEAYASFGATAIKWSYDGQFTATEITCSGGEKKTKATFDGVEFSKGLKFESSAGKVTITIASAKTLTVYQNGGTTIKINGTAVNASDLVDYNLTAGTYELTKGNGSAVIYYIVLK